jgi:hypothetical protein
LSGKGVSRGKRKAADNRENHADEVHIQGRSGRMAGAQGIVERKTYIVHSGLVRLLTIKERTTCSSVVASASTCEVGIKQTPTILEALLGHFSKIHRSSLGKISGCCDVKLRDVPNLLIRVAFELNSP